MRRIRALVVSWVSPLLVMVAGLQVQLAVAGTLAQRLTSVAETVNAAFPPMRYVWMLVYVAPATAAGILAMQLLTLRDRLDKYFARAQRGCALLWIGVFVYLSVDLFRSGMGFKDLLRMGAPWIIALQLPLLSGKVRYPLERER